MPQYMLLLHERPADDAQMSPAELKEIVSRYKAWAEQLAARGQLAGGEKLADDGGRVLRLQGGRPVAHDGPYAEAHDVVGGYFTIVADDDAAAEAIAGGCPHLRGRNWIEIRRVDPVGG
ncbi:MAG: YciI family protein [Rubrivivax sp.]